MLICITYLTSLGLRVLFLDLDFHDVTGMLDDFGNVGLVSATDFTRGSLSKVRKSTVHPVFPENTNAIAKGRKIRLDQAEGTVNGPENEEDNEQMMGIPKSFELGPSVFLCCGDDHGGQGNQHDITGPSGTGSKVGKKETNETEVPIVSKDPQVPPMRNGV